MREQIDQLQKKLADEAAQVSALEKDKQQLACGRASAQNEIAALQQRAANLEAETTRVAKEREQLRQQQTLLTASLEQERTRLKAEVADKARLEQERATNVVRYLIDQGSIAQQHLSAVGYAETRPLGSNDNEAGRSANRRIEIVLHPKDLSVTTEQAGSTSPDGK